MSGSKKPPNRESYRWWKCWLDSCERQQGIGLSADVLFLCFFFHIKIHIYLSPSFLCSDDGLPGSAESSAASGSSIPGPDVLLQTGFRQWRRQAMRRRSTEGVQGVQRGAGGRVRKRAVPPGHGNQGIHLSGCSRDCPHWPHPLVPCALCL